jgi:NAD(P)-dependent dehydrogenase (short-subunit alcohol dehydrogenase family)
MSNFKDKIVLITGANRGFGLSAARAFAESGATVFVAGRDADACEIIARSIQAAGHSAYGLQLDVTDFGSAEAALAEISRRCGRLDILINNAALGGPLSRVLETNAQDWRRSLETNLIGPFNVVRAALPPLLARSGIVVNVGAAAAEIPFEGMSAYCCGKAGLAMLTRTLHLEYGEAGLRAFGFRPGMIDTDMQTEIRTSRVNKISDVPREKLNSPDVPARALLLLCGEKGQALLATEVAWNDPRLDA